MPSAPEYRGRAPGGGGVGHTQSLGEAPQATWTTMARQPPNLGGEFLELRLGATQFATVFFEVRSTVVCEVGSGLWPKGTSPK